MLFCAKTLLPLLAAGLLLPVTAQDFIPEKNGGWKPAMESQNGEYVIQNEQRIVSAAAFRVDPNATYELSGKFRSDGSDPQMKYLCFGAEAYTPDFRVIGSPQINVFPGTETELAKELKAGDPAVYVKDASNWKQKNGAVAALDIKDGYADLPNFNYTPDIAKIEKEDGVWRIQLKRPSSKAFPAGTRVREHAHGQGRTFFAASYRRILPGEWREVKATVSGMAAYGMSRTQWWKGTSAASICIQGTPGVRFRDIVLKKIGGAVELVPASERQMSISKPHPLFRKYYSQLKRDIKRPRVIFTEEGFEKMRRQLKTNPLLKKGFDRLVAKVDSYPDEITEDAYRKVYWRKDKFGPTAMRCAFVWKLTGEEKYLKKGIRLLAAAAKWYNAQYAAQKAIHWYAFKRIGALCAYDWMYDGMTEAERKEIGTELMKHVVAAQNTGWIIKTGMQDKGEGTSGWQASFYGTPLMKFYAGLAFRNAGIDDEKAELMLMEGLSDHLKMLSHRAEISGVDGGGNTSSPGYAFGEAPVCEWYFYYAWENLTGHNIAMDFPANGMFPHWLFYATFPGMDGSLLEYGVGDGWHMDNKVNLNLRYLAQYRHFFDNHPAAWLIDHFITLQDDFKNDEVIYGSVAWPPPEYPPWQAFQFKYTSRADCRPDPGLFAKFPKAYFFRNLGQTYMFSGRGKDDTYALFTCGSQVPLHKQRDENNFIIYKGGFLALDSGSRSGSGMPDWLDDMYHVCTYYESSIAHNVVLIRMEGETFTGWPGKKYHAANHGGMYKNVGGIVKAFETNDLFTYICGDSTACYRPEKCKKMIRQFVFIRPDYFVICDTVESVKPDQTQAWLLHSQNEPVEEDDVFHFDEGAGRLFCRTFLPKGYKRTKIGGPGREFWVDGKNWPLGKTRMEIYRKRNVKKTLWGNWRVELTAGKPTAKVRFLNLIQVGMKDRLPKMVNSEYVKDGLLEGVRFTAADGTAYTVLFNEAGTGGKIKAARGGKVLLDRPLSNQVQKQTPFQK